MHKASQMMTIVHDLNQPYQLSSGWYERFLCGHSELKTGKSRILSKARNSFDVDTVVDFYHELVHSMSLVGFEHSRVYNMDVTSFSPNKATPSTPARRVVDLSDPLPGAPPTAPRNTYASVLGRGGSHLPSGTVKATLSRPTRTNLAKLMELASDEATTDEEMFQAIEASLPYRKRIGTTTFSIETNEPDLHQLQAHVLVAARQFLCTPQYLAGLL
ncbi:hypothetical protein H310_14548 [Aphanomyces invadans]|uniref:HTH CENPB-type domain-containing protein n=1 Tax=Aphanomyces invadans TaxID=157072 RepID=A0A024T9I5_9STRA|nr:hypothetical protein H310_14548 [Aphanomyces invadans]ETV90708.1 hypothetical protein H310_14548 [Aphanomyces invadans]|eukprot:XP_008880648.1 hypothetical protein H310_14548 [Aphanomyces invadans]